jgi:hypothetical protein
MSLPRFIGYDLGMLMNLYLLGEKMGVDQPHCQRKIQAALELILPYVENEKDWPLEQIAATKESYKLYPVLLVAATSI